MLLYKSGIKRSVEADSVKYIKPFDFSRNTTYGLGGKAKIAYFPKTVWEAKKVFDKLNSGGEKFTVLGNGSNLLVSDAGFDGAVISTRQLRGIIRLNKTSLMCMAGTKISELLAYCKRKGLGGLEYLYGIPATVGGAVYMNAGVSGFAIGKDVKSVYAYDGNDLRLSRENCKFGYRHSTMRDINAVILSIIVKVNEISAEEIDERINFFKQRRSHLPKGKSCGCVFKNPLGASAGQLIDSAGMKGFAVGGARVSAEHASFIINDGGTAGDVKAVIEIVKRRVFEKFGVLLEEEVVYIGEFNDFNG